MVRCSEPPDADVASSLNIVIYKYFNSLSYFITAKSSHIGDHNQFVKILSLVLRNHLLLSSI